MSAGQSSLDYCHIAAIVAYSRSSHGQVSSEIRDYLRLTEFYLITNEQLLFHTGAAFSVSNGFEFIGVIKVVFELKPPDFKFKSHGPSDQSPSPL